MANNHVGYAVDAAAFARQLDAEGEVNLREVPIGSIVKIATQNSVYEYDVDANTVRGGILGDQWIAGHVAGSTFGGSMIAVDRLLVGALAEIVANGIGPITTSPISAIEVAVS